MPPHRESRESACRLMVWTLELTLAARFQNRPTKEYQPRALPAPRISCAFAVLKIASFLGFQNLENENARTFQHRPSRRLELIGYQSRQINAPERFYGLRQRNCAVSNTAQLGAGFRFSFANSRCLPAPPAPRMTPVRPPPFCQSRAASPGAATVSEQQPRSWLQLDRLTNSGSHVRRHIQLRRRATCIATIRRAVSWYSIGRPGGDPLPPTPPPPGEKPRAFS